MDNDLMTPGLRAPSPQTQPVEPMSQPAPHVSPDSAPDSPSAPPLMQLPPLPQLADLPQWPPAPVSPTPMSPPPVPAAWEQVAAMPDPGSVARATEARDEVPWDRPDDYEQPTDTASGDDQRSWDKPPDEAWVDSTPMWLPVANAVSTQQTFDSFDPEDAHAPVLGDLSPTTMARAWPETNGHDADRNAATVGQRGFAEAAAPVVNAAVAQPTEQSPSSPWAPLPVSPTPSQPMAPAPADPAAVPTQWPLPAQAADAVAPVPIEWPLPSDPAPNPTEWSVAAQPVDPGPAAGDWPLPADPAPAAMEWPVPDAAPSSTEWSAAAQPAPQPAPEASQWPLPAPTQSDATEPVSTLTLWPMAAQPTDYAERQMGPTPPPELFATVVPSQMTQAAESAVSPAAPQEQDMPEPVHAEADAWLYEPDEWPSDSDGQPHEAPVTEAPPQAEQEPFTQAEGPDRAFYGTQYTDAPVAEAGPRDAETIEPDLSEPAFNEAQVADSAFADADLSEPAFNEAQVADSAFTEPEVSEPETAESHSAPVVSDEPASMVVEAKLPVVAADGTQTPIVLRIELAIVNDQLRVLNVGDHVSRVTPDHETGPVTPDHETAPAAPDDEIRPVTQHDSASEPSNTNGGDGDRPDLAQFIASLASVSTTSDDATPTPEAEAEPVPPVPDRPSWALAPFVSAPDPEPEPATDPRPAPALQTDTHDALVDVPWAQDPPSMDPLAAIPALPLVAQPLQPVPAPTQSVEAMDLAQAAPSPTSFATSAEEQAPAPYLTPMAAAAAAPAAASPAAAIAPTATADQNLWFVSTEPHDIDAVTGDEGETPRKGTSTVLTAVVTIGMAILVVVLVLVFFNLITSLLG